MMLGVNKQIKKEVGKKAFIIGMSICKKAKTPTSCMLWFIRIL